MPHEINISQYHGDDIIVISGRPKGEWVRKEERLNELDQEKGPIIVNIPNNVRLITSSFLLGLFGDSIRYFGKEGFKNKYQFEGKDISRKLEICIHEALKTKSPI